MSANAMAMVFATLRVVKFGITAKATQQTVDRAVIQASSFAGPTRNSEGDGMFVLWDTTHLVMIDAPDKRYRGTQSKRRWRQDGTGFI